ncbi:hypothetical protein [Sediminibacterium soli]|uniref:hypothetical protein n=1 Tax=Sediminibacterium soli TaxID=2698829 RepID=UPI001379C5AE|nr:hypothetical protein [Sediminibacterium soli]NCI45323.1 hypothetical protein [Sediminibacterium soli]
MKTQAIVTIAKRFFFGNLLAATMFLSANANTTDKTAAFEATKAEVKYTGVDKDNQLSFKVTYSNPSGSTFLLSVLDEQGEILYKSHFEDKNFNKTFKLPKSEVSKLTFVIEDPKTAAIEKYSVNVKTSVQEEVVVSKN